MNDTQVNIRQLKLLEYLLFSPLSARVNIAKNLIGVKFSRITIIRDLNLLTKLGWVIQSGSGNYVKYSVSPEKELLVPANVEEYFLKDADSRKVKYLNYNFDLINNLKDIFTQDEIDIFENGKQKLLSKFSSLDKTLLKKELERFTIELSWKSSQIEGNTYSLLDTEELIKNKKEAKGHSKEEAIMIINHKAAFDIILENRKSFKEISIMEIRSIHTRLSKGLGIKTGIRESGVGITGTKYVPLDNKWQIEEAVSKLIKQVKKSKNVAEKALIFLAMISYIQPFVDGNKRTSRMVSNAILLANGYFPLSYRSVDEVEYKKAMILLYEQNNISYLKKIFIEQQKFAIEKYFL